jgi:16S rRNA (guanine527-N7)-methyltransferase
VAAEDGTVQSSGRGVGNGPAGADEAVQGRGAVARDGGARYATVGSPPGIEHEPALAELLFGDRIGLARRYVEALAIDGVVRGLIGPREPSRLWTRHVLNSAALAELIPRDAAVVDIGSGAGLPGIPLAIVRPDLRVTLVEPLERRVRFLIETVDGLRLTNCRVVRGRAEDVVAECGGADVVTSRAVAPLHRLVLWSAPLARDGGMVLAMKGESAHDELRRDRAAVVAAGLVDAAVLELVPRAAGESSSRAGESTYVISARRRAGASRPVRSKRHR